MLGLISAFFSRNAIAVAALAGLVTWASIGIKKHDRQVARVAVQEVQENARATVRKAKTAQRRVDPDGARGVLGSKYCIDCGR